MKVCLLNGRTDPAPCHHLLEALGNEVVTIDVAASSADDLAFQRPDLILWNFSSDSASCAGDLEDFSRLTGTGGWHCAAVVPRGEAGLEGAVHARGVDLVLSQPVLVHDLADALSRGPLGLREPRAQKNLPPLVLVAGQCPRLRAMVDDAELEQTHIVMSAPELVDVQRLTAQISFDGIVLCESVESGTREALLGHLRQHGNDAAVIGFLDTDDLPRHSELGQDIVWSHVSRGVTHFLDTMKETLDQRRREVRRRELDVEIVSKQRELQRVNSMLRTVNKAFRDTNLRLEREGHTKDQMIGVAAHELKSPLAAMAGALDFLCDDLERYGADDRRLLELMQRNNRRMIKLVENVLDLSRVESRRKTLNPVSCDPHALLDAAAETVLLRASEKGISFDFGEPVVLGQWWADAEAVIQMLVNLLDNAVKFSPRESVVRALVRLFGGEIHFIVSDEGPGIPPEERDTIFERFHHRSRGDDLHSAGSGLGLTITKALAEYMNGRVTAGESPSGGALLTVSLPFNLAPSMREGVARH